uniref:peptidylprolyl isomerase n=1 Tax=Oncorhynchus kisutch TaxID=8019 RepID=A0A8C7CN84_ONCKI
MFYPHVAKKMTRFMRAIHSTRHCNGEVQHVSTSAVSRAVVQPKLVTHEASCLSLTIASPNIQPTPIKTFEKSLSSVSHFNVICREWIITFYFDSNHCLHAQSFFLTCLPFTLFQCSEQGKLLADGKVIDSSLSRDPLVVELGKRTVIPGLEQSLVGVCEGQKIKTTIPPHLAYGKRGYPPTIPADAALEFEVEVILILYLMISSVVGFYSSPLFTGLRPRAQDTTLTQVHTHTHTHCSLSLPWGILIITQLSSSLFSDYWELCFSIGAQLSSACIF